MKYRTSLCCILVLAFLATNAQDIADLTSIKGKSIYFLVQTNTESKEEVTSSFARKTPFQLKISFEKEGACMEYDSDNKLIFHGTYTLLNKGKKIAIVWSKTVLTNYSIKFYNDTYITLQNGALIHYCIIAK